MSEWCLPKETFDVMRDQNVVISGSVALNVVEPGCVVPRDLDLYVPLGGVVDFDKFLTDLTDYVQVTKEDYTDLGALTDNYVAGHAWVQDTGMRTVVFYRHKTSGTVLNVIESSHPVPTTTIFKFHSTFVMNYISWNGVICAYPKMTADRVGLLNTKDRELTPRMKRCMIKYALRGFETLNPVVVRLATVIPFDSLSVP
ncbi:hypothetical protein EST38_g9409 [Candolleomyces aberdarensis]|uniref:Uncharacterized protein n=1 Tax=Candolleomyces aberdarensis TaxID=2316362 RepID=A0A4Q2DCX6_9AGAR|nr:hypothetical protein EST38_g9409 [Candolleomyces aberdarensis]